MQIKKPSKARGTVIVLFVILIAGIAIQRPADAQSCSDRYCQFNLGDYIVQNDEWGLTADPTGTQKISVDGKGWSATANWAFTNRSVKSYPSIVAGWNFGGNWTPNHDGFPVRVSANASLPTATNWSITRGFPHYDAAYDLFMSPDRNPSKPSAEMMVWLGYQGQQPAGSQVASSVSLPGIPGTWNVWVGNVGWPVYSFVRTQSAHDFRANLGPFIHYLAYTHKYLNPRWYILDMQFGAEILEGNGKFVDKSFYGKAAGTARN